MPAVESPVELIPRITYFLSPGPKSWTDRPGIWPAMSMNADEPARCSESPLIAWIDTGISRTFCALSLLAVTTISSIGADSLEVSAATAGHSSCRSRHIAAHAPEHREGRREFLRRDTLQQALLAATHHDIERVEQRAALVGKEYLDIAGVVAAQHSPDIVFLFHVHEGAAERRLLHHRSIDDFVDGDAVAHGQHGQDTPARDVDALVPQLLDQIVVELVRQPGDQMRKEIIEHRLVRRLQRVDRGASRACKGSRPFDSSHVRNGLWPLRMAPSFGASMLPPETMQIISPLPAWPVMAAATDAAPAASAMM